jgi:hypothetical protein
MEMMMWERIKLEECQPGDILRVRSVSDSIDRTLMELKTPPIKVVMCCNGEVVIEIKSDGVKIIDLWYDTKVQDMFFYLERKTNAEK